jgi:glycosyltransferase involved in cell wall biosynthesis
LRRKLLAGFLLATVVIGLLYLLYRVYCKAAKYWLQRRHLQVVVPIPVARYLDRLRRDGKQLSTQKRSKEEEVKSFGAFLGSFDMPITLGQAEMLSQWDVVVLDPLQTGVLDALSICEPTCKHILGRMDVRMLTALESASNNGEIIRSLIVVAETLVKKFTNQQHAQSPFTGVVLAECHGHFQPVVLNEVVKYINGVGLDVWLEMSPPAYLTESQCRDINMSLIRGLIYRNGTIRRDGDRQNYFQMTEMRTAMRTIAAQRVRHGPPMIMWETVDNGVELQYAVVKRSFDWCSYNSALCWVGSEAALTHADVSAARTVADKPLGALMWLKGESVMKAHDLWRSNDQIAQTSCGHDALYDSLQSFVPDLSAKLRLSRPNGQGYLANPADVIDGLDYFTQPSDNEQIDPLSRSADREDLTGLGCFHLGLEVEPKDFLDILRTQLKLKELNLLQRLDSAELQDLSKHIKSLCDAQITDRITSATTEAIQEFLNLLHTSNTDGDALVQVHVGLHSGFQTSSKVQFWGVYDFDAESEVLNIYISGKTYDRTATILHTFLSSRMCARYECFMAEYALSELNDSLSEKWQLPPRVLQDVEHLSPTETILFLRWLVSSGRTSDAFLRKLAAYCRYRLLEVPTLTQLRVLSSTAYLSNEVSAEALVRARLDWLRERGGWRLDASASLSVFEEVEARLQDVLVNGETDIYAQIGVVIQTIIQSGQIDASADIFALSVFCAFRKLALGEIYLEVMDRNPYPNHATEQAACFAENFALGSRCDSFFDTTPSSLGRIISDRYRAYYMKHQPPPREESFTELPTAYAAMQADLDPRDGQEVPPTYYKITFLGIFAVPALIDIMLLTTIGRGLYLTTFMSSTQKTMATTALMVALLACGAVGSWISSGGSYYLFANAFPAMNMFVLTRFVAGVAIILVVGAAGLVGFGVSRGIEAGIVFFFYFAMLTTYLMTLSALSIYQVPGSSFQSGRTVIMTCIPILFISPVASLWLRNDIVVYFCVLSFFLISLLMGARSTMAQWSTWYLKIPSVTDTEVVDWYLRTQGLHSSALSDADEMEDAGKSSEPRQALHAAVLKERNRHFWTPATKDPLIAKLAAGYSSTTFLVSWYCKFKRNRMPLPYTPTWNLTLKAGLENMTNMQKGLKLHSAFLHWRNTGADIWSGVLYFVVALMDKWVALLSGGNLVGLSAAGSAQFRLAVGFGLCYYLIGAVSLDAVSQPLWIAANQNTVQPITSLKFLRQAIINDRKARRALYWRHLAKFFFLHIWGATITSALIWVFDGSRDATALYLAYVGAYSGLLWYQYSKIYCGNDAAKSLAIAMIIGLPAGVALHKCMPTFAFSGVISLAVGTWIAAFHSLWMSKIGWSIFQRSKSTKSGTLDEAEHTEKADFERYSSSVFEPYPELSQATLAKTFNYISSLSAKERYTLDPSQHPGARVMGHLMVQSKTGNSEIVQSAFSAPEQLVQQTANLWASGKTVVQLVSARHFPRQEQRIRTVARRRGDQLHVFVILGQGIAGDQWTIDMHRNCRIIAEAVVQASAETQLGLSHDHSMLAELLAVDGSNSSGLSVPEGVKRQLETSSAECARVINNGDRTLLRYLLLGLDCEKEWDQLPKTIRAFLLERCCGLSRPLSASERSWVRSKFCDGYALTPEEHVARCQLGASLTYLVVDYAKTMEAHDEYDKEDSETSSSSCGTTLEHELSPGKHKSKLASLKLNLNICHQKLQGCIKFFVLSLTADPEYQRELDFVMRTKPLFLRWPMVFFLNTVWSYCKVLQNVILPVAMFHGRENVSRLYSNMKCMKTVIEKNRIVIESLNGASTCFITAQPDGTLKMSQYKGRHDSEPEDLKQLTAINAYSDRLLLTQREERTGSEIVNLFTYEYDQQGNKSTSKLPVQRQCLKGKLVGQVAQYDHRGYITTGSTFRGVNPVTFTYWYRRSAKFEDELLRGEYVFPHITIRVSWSMPPKNHATRLDEWIPFKKVTEATFIEGSNVHHASWTYEHKAHPEIWTTLNGEPVVTPPLIREDWFRVLEKPGRCGFLSDNPLLSFSSAKSSFISRRFGLNVKRYPIPTSHARTHLWKTWKEGKELDAIAVRWLDERILRSDRILTTYWRNRDFGRLDAAKKYLDAQADTIMARTDMDPELSSWLHIAFKISDYYSFGQGGDSTINTRTMNSQLQDSDDELHILAMDTSTWPNEPGGVSACRRDMVNDLKTIKWHIVAESANDYGVPRFQIERNVHSLTILPLWGLDFLNPTHGILENSLDSAVVKRSHDTRAADVERNFLPILESLVKCSRTISLTPEHIDEATKALVDLNTYFESSRNWNDVWNYDVVKQRWRELWLTEEMPDTLSVSQWWDFEKPTMLQLDQALNMWHRYLFIFSIQVPEKIPDVFQASHHFTGATYGILCKVKRNCTLHVWDHCISFREFTVFMSSAVSFDSPFVNSSLISLGHLSCVLLEHHADVVLPCAAYFNPGWEVELGTAEGGLEHRRTFARKIDPVVNGICNVEKFEPIKAIKTDKPTAVMLSHVQYVKDIKNAITAADLIVNKWGFKDYCLHVYGDMERAAGLSAECQELIASKGLREHCVLKGLGNPSKVLQDAWLFLNSSISEGLPLAMGEAALTGVPVVCTDVGASFCVVTDSASGDRFSEVVSPNDAESLARAQISILALIDRWSVYAEDEPGTQAPILAYPNPTREQVQQITERMYAKTEQRRALGMLGRKNVLKNFSSERYLREHEQMLWIGKYRSGSYRARISRLPSSNNSSVWFNKEKAVFVPTLISPLVTPRLPPDSWVSLSDALNVRSSTASSLKSWLKDKQSKSRSFHRWNQDSLSSNEGEAVTPIRHSAMTSASGSVLSLSRWDITSNSLAINSPLVREVQRDEERGGYFAPR